MPFLRFMAGPVGRTARIAAGIAAAVLAFVVGFPVGYILLAVAALLVYVGVANVCLLGPIFRGPLLARDIPAKPNPEVERMKRVDAGTR